MDSTKTQPAPYPQPSSILWGEQILMSSLDTAHRKLSTAPKDKYQDQ